LLAYNLSTGCGRYSAEISDTGRYDSFAYFFQDCCWRGMDDDDVPSGDMKQILESRKDADQAKKLVKEKSVN
jgi:hypothetical protein